MALCMNSLCNTLCRRNIRRFVTVAKAQDISDEPLQIFRTHENNPINHTQNHLHRFYTIPSKHVTQLFKKDSLPIEFQTLIKTFAEYSLMVRQPAVEIISYFNQTDYSMPVNRYVLYGIQGSGKTVTLTHLLHHALMSKKIIVYLHWAKMWYSFPKECANSPLEEGLIDIPVDAGLWLVQFKSQNHALLKELDLKVTNNYQWNQRESTTTGRSLIELIDFGINRIKYACGVINALLNELKLASIEGKCKTFIAIDGYNALWDQKTNVVNEKKEAVLPDAVSITSAFKSITNYDWINGDIVVTVDRTASVDRGESDYPRYLLGKEGFEHLDPFLPIEVTNYDSNEFDSVIEYYKNRKWIREISPKGVRELKLLSNENPWKLMDLCRTI